MDPHFREYLAAVAGMQEVYGFDDDHADIGPADVRRDLALEGLPSAGDAIPAVVGCG